MNIACPVRAKVRCTFAAWLVALPLTLSAATITPTEEHSMQTVTGPFDVKMIPETDTTAENGSARMALDKRYHGPLDATALGTLLGSHSAVEGSAGYVAIERVTGTLAGRRGSFVLQHFGLMDRGKPHLDIRVVPDSGDGELTGLSGRMTIQFESGGAHFYTFEYTLP